MIKPRWSPERLADELRTLSLQMQRVAWRMTEHGGEIAAHGAELRGAGKIARTWAVGIEESIRTEPMIPDADLQGTLALVDQMVADGRMLPLSKRL